MPIAKVSTLLVPIASLPPGISIEFANGIGAKANVRRRDSKSFRRFIIKSVLNLGEIFKWGVYIPARIKFNTRGH
jgi:hypothetical protein